MKRSTLLIMLVFALLAIGNTAAAVCHTVPEDSTPKIQLKIQLLGEEPSEEIKLLIGPCIPGSIYMKLEDLLEEIKRKLEEEDMNSFEEKIKQLKDAARMPAVQIGPTRAPSP